MKNTKELSIINLTLILFSFSLHAQIAPDTYWVSFTDKNNTPYSIQKPEEFLSERSIARRVKQDIGIAEDDLPVNQTDPHLFRFHNKLQMHLCSTTLT